MTTELPTDFGFLRSGRTRGLDKASGAGVGQGVRGCQKKQATRQLERFLSVITSEDVIPFDQAAAELAGRIAGELERIGLADPMIAALALTHGLELVTANTAHFRSVENLGYPLTLVNWRLP